jgi:predicted dehydrogenase
LSTQYRVAIIGTGRMGGLIDDEQGDRSYMTPYGHFPSYEAIPETTVVAVANRGKERLERFCKRFSFSNAYLDYREMIEKEKPDIVSVTTPSFARAEPIIFCAEHGVKGIFAEKGLCASLEEADRIHEAVTRNNVAFNWGAQRRHHDAYKRLRDAIQAGAIGRPIHVLLNYYTDIIKHHPHTIDLVQMMLGDPKPVWVEGRLVDHDDPRVQDIEKAAAPYDAEKHAFIPLPGLEIADPMADFFRVGYETGAVGYFVPTPRSFDLDVRGTEGRAISWDNGTNTRIQRPVRRGDELEETTIHATGDPPGITNIRNIIREIETGERTDGNIDVTMQAVEVQFGLANSSLQGGARVSLPAADRSLYIPGG